VSHIKKENSARGGLSQVVEYLSCRYEALNSNPTAATNTNKNPVLGLSRERITESKSN
jgi:hypothetical protein